MSHWVRRAARRETGISEKTPNPSVGPEKFAEMIVWHRDGIAAYCKPEDKVVLGFSEGMNNKIRVVTRRSYGFRTYKGMEMALYHNLGRLPEPPVTHRFC